MILEHTAYKSIGGVTLLLKVYKYPHTSAWHFLIKGYGIIGILILSLPVSYSHVLCITIVTMWSGRITTESGYCYQGGNEKTVQDWMKCVLKGACQNQCLGIM